MPVVESSVHARPRGGGAGWSRPWVRRMARSRAISIPVLAVILACAAGVVGVGTQPAAATGGLHYIATSTSWLNLPSTFVQGWDGTHHRVAVNQIGSNGISEGYWTSETGSGMTCVTCAVPDTSATQRGISDVFPGGDYVVMTAEKSSHPGTIGDSSAQPGKGLYNDLYIAKSDGTVAWPMTNIPNDANHGLIWPRLNPAGTKIVWAEMYQGSNIWSGKQLLGTWQLKLADIVWTNGVPSLANVRVYEPEQGNFYEPYGFSPDGTQILFSSSAYMPGVGDDQIYRVSTSFTGLQRLSDQYRTGWWNYNEFAFYAPDGSHIIYGRTKDSAPGGGNSVGGLDYWIMNADGTNPTRLTYMNEPWSTMYAGYTNMGGWAIDPTNPNHILAGACHDTTCNTGNVVSLNLRTIAAGAGTGVSATYFSDTWLISPVASRQDSNIGFEFGSDAPAPGAPTTNYSVRWTGKLIPYVTGTYSLCTYTDDGARLWINGTIVVDAWYNQGPTEHCGSVTLNTSGTYTLKMEMYNAYGTGTAKLTWVVPGQPTTTKEVIPPSQLLPS